MNELLSSMRGGEIIGLVAVAGGLLCGIVSIVIGGLYKMRQLSLKEEMVQRGMSADEICAVIGSGSSSCKDKREVRTS